MDGVTPMMDVRAQTQGHSSNRVNQTLLKPEILARKENWNRAFLRFGCAFRWRSGSSRITTDGMSKLTQVIRGRRANKKDHWMNVVRMKVVRIRVFNTSVLLSY